MFGYIKPRKSELRVRELECYKATYCGLCHSMGKVCGRAFCGTLSYDFAFLAIIRMTLEGIHPEFEERRCAAHPFKKRPAVKTNQSLEYCSAAAAILSYGKCRDDISDEKGLVRLRARLALPFFGGARKKALKKFPELSALDERVSKLLLEMSKAEKDTSSDPSADRLGELFGFILGEIISFGLEGIKAKLGASLGRAVGHWLYLTDAADDYDDDAKRGRFNPFLAIYGEGGFDEGSRRGVSDAMIVILMDAERAVDLIEFKTAEFYEITRNILYLGMPDETKKVLNLQKDRS